MSDKDRHRSKTTENFQILDERDLIHLLFSCLIYSLVICSSACISLVIVSVGHGDAFNTYVFVLISQAPG